MFRAFYDMYANFADFSTRTSRRDYWLAFLANSLIIIVLVFLSLIPILHVFFIILIIPNAAIIVRRLHDTGLSGWWYFISFVPFGIGLLILTILTLSGSDEDNEYGPKPQYVAFWQLNRLL